MNNHLLFDFLVDKENKTITVRKEFAADLSIVWDAFTKADLLDLWWGPKPWVSKTKSMDFREGGTRLYSMLGPNGEEHWAIFKYEKIEKPEYFTALAAFTDPTGIINTELPRTTWKVSFRSKGETTLVEAVLTFLSLSDLEAEIQMGFKEGFTICLKTLDQLWSVVKQR